MGAKTRSCTIVDWWCGSPVKLAKAVKTPLGGNVTVVTVCVDIQFVIEENEVVVRGVSLSRSSGSGLGGANIAAQRRGEAWYATQICSEVELIEVVNRELAQNGSRLRKAMMGMWRSANAGATIQKLLVEFNAAPTAECLRRLIQAVGPGANLVFQYSKPTGESEIRRVSSAHVVGELLQAVDQKDGKSKSFRIDRMSEMRPAESQASKKGCLAATALLIAMIAVGCHLWHAAWHLFVC